MKARDKENPETFVKQGVQEHVALVLVERHNTDEEEASDDQSGAAESERQRIYKKQEAEARSGRRKANEAVEREESSVFTTL